MVHHQSVRDRAWRDGIEFICKLFHGWHLLSNNIPSQSQSLQHPQFYSLSKQCKTTRASKERSNVSWLSCKRTTNMKNRLNVNHVVHSIVPGAILFPSIHAFGGYRKSLYHLLPIVVLLIFNRVTIVQHSGSKMFWLGWTKAFSELLHMNMILMDTKSAMDRRAKTTTRPPTRWQNTYEQRTLHQHR